MTIQPSPEDLPDLIAMSTENAAPPKSAAARHYMSLTLDGGAIRIVFECRHEPVTSEYVQCAGESADEFGFDFLEWFNGPQTDAPAELRNGLIDIWWDGYGEDAELYWEYVEFMRPPRGPSAARADANIDIAEIGTATTITVLREDLPQVQITHGNEVSRLLSIGQQEIERGHGTNIDFCTESFYEQQLLDAIAALRYLRVHSASV